MDNICVVVADARRARLFMLQENEAPRAPYRLAERGTLNSMSLRALGRSVTGRVRTETNTNRQAGPMHPMGAQRERHRIELERRFATAIARRAAVLARNWVTGSVVLVAEPRMLGFLRGAVLSTLRPAIRVKELAKDYARLTATVLVKHLAADGIVPAGRSSGT